MKKLISMLLAVVMFFAMPVGASAMSMSRLPLAEEENCDYKALEKDVTLKTDLTIEEDEILVIPNGKKITLKNEKSITLNGKLFIEEGGSLIIDSGEFLISGGAAVFSGGKINVKKSGTLTAAADSSMIVSPSGSLSLKGEAYIDLESACVVCLGEYSGSPEGVKAEIIGAVSFAETDIFSKVFEDYKTYGTDTACELFPKDIAINKLQSNPSGGIKTQIRLFCSNGQTIRLAIHGDIEGENAILNGMFVKIGGTAQ